MQTDTTTQKSKKKSKAAPEKKAASKSPRSSSSIPTGAGATAVIKGSSQSDPAGRYSPSIDKNKDQDRKDVLAKIAARQDFEGLAEQLANSREVELRYAYDGGEKHFDVESDPYLLIVDKYFPYAEGGPLLVDEPVQPHHRERCERKRPVLEALGLCYVVITPETTEEDAFMELDECRGRLLK